MTKGGRVKEKREGLVEKGKAMNTEKEKITEVVKKKGETGCEREGKEWGKVEEILGKR